MANQYIYDLTDTWNNGGTTYNGIKLNVTDSASAADSLLLNLQVGSTTKYSIAKDGSFAAVDTSYFFDPADTTKRVRFDAGGVTTGNTRVWTAPDADVTFGAFAPTLLNNATAIATLDDLHTQSTSIASATTTDLSTATGYFVHITGTTTITAFSSQTAGILRVLVFDGALTLTHNATSLILPSGANITTAAGDIALMVSEGSGNWRCLAYTDVSAGTPLYAASNLSDVASATTARTNLGLGTGDSPQFTAVNVGHATDTTVARASAGVISVEGNHVPSPASQAQCDILYHNGTTWARLAKGTASQVLKINSGATAPEWADETGGQGTIEAWVNFNGTGTVAIRASGNVSSITDNGTGDYTVNFSSALADANYAYAISCGAGATGTRKTLNAPSGVPTSNAFRFETPGDGGGPADTEYISAIFIR